MHRTSAKTRSLSVQRETLRVLAGGELKSVEGGTGYVRGANSVVANSVLEVCYVDPHIIVGQDGSVIGACRDPDPIGRIVLPVDIIGRP